MCIDSSAVVLSLKNLLVLHTVAFQPWGKTSGQHSTLRQSHGTAQGRVWDHILLSTDSELSWVIYDCFGPKAPVQGQAKLIGMDLNG